VTRTLPGVEGPHADAALVVAGAPAAAAEVAVVLLHGRGGTAEGMIRLVDDVYRPGVALLAPAARRSSWFPAGHDEPIEANEPALSSAVDCVAGAVAAAGDVGIPADRVLLVGVSQGGCVLAEFLCRRPRRFGGAFVASAALPGSTPGDRTVDSGNERTRPKSRTPPLDGTPVAIDVTEADPYVSRSRVDATAAVLERGGAAVDLRIDPGSDHGLSDATIDRIGTRLDALADG